MDWIYGGAIVAAGMYSSLSFRQMFLDRCSAVSVVGLQVIYIIDL